ncbi:GSM1 [Candida pseudojiufengensis]|uniref:GSM1 n=1 Tax=Candida pseudojiufengensis TaxID=497109 RepID=UPI002224ADE5|nr:GSM1 [Candida pseudojiufengensis]KAI5964567.1 GSM1 [Candida pseudojiufengensis]
MTKRLTPQEKLNRKPTSRACTFCHEKHLQCSNERPCKNCVKRNIADTCRDIVRKRVKYLTGTTKSTSKKKKTETSNEPSSNLQSFSNSPENGIKIEAHESSRALIPHIPQQQAQFSPELNQQLSNQLPQAELIEQNIPMPLNNHSSILPNLQPQQQHTFGLPVEDPNVNQIKDILNAPSFDAANKVNSSNKIDLSPSRILETDSLQYHTNTMLNTTTDVLNKLLTDYYETDSLLSQPTQPAIHQQQPSQENLGTPLGVSQSNKFNSNYLNEEYMMLGDILLQSKPTSPSPSNTSASEFNDALNFSNIDFDNINQPKKKVVQKLKDSRPFISLGFPKDSSLSLNNLVNMADQTDNLLDNNVTSRGNSKPVSSSNPIIDFKTKYKTDYVSPLATHQIYQTVLDIYSKDVINFEYPNSYHALTHFLKTRFSGNNLSPEEKSRKRQNLLVILKLIASYRPTFISAHKSLLKPQDLLFLEMSFQRCLVDYEKLSQLNSSPTIIWRRTGEIVSITDDLLSLLGYKLTDILSKRTFIMEIMYDDDSIVKYFQLFKSVAVGNLHSSISTKIKLIKKESNTNNNSNNEIYGSNGSAINNVGTNSYIEFCSVWTVKRDLFDIPMLIIGQFLPILPAGDGVRMY